MNYKYKRNQIFGKRLKVPRQILFSVYDCNVTFSEFIEYHLDDKIPISCLGEPYRSIVQKFGIEKCKELDWELIDDYKFDDDFLNILLSIDPTISDVNQTLYELVKDKICPAEYSSKMKKVYSDRLFEITPSKENEATDVADSEHFIQSLKEKFNYGGLSLYDIIRDWELFKNKDLSYCLLKDRNNTNHITNEQLKSFMSTYGSLANIIVSYSNNNIFDVIRIISTLSTDEEIHNYITQITDDILSNKWQVLYHNEVLKELFKYSSIEEYLGKISPNSPLIKELKSLPQDYIFNTDIPFYVFVNESVLYFVEEYGLKNVVDFDQECGHFFSNNNCKVLESMFEMYLKYNRGIDSRESFEKIEYDENGDAIPYTKDEFYEVIRRMIIYGAINWDESPDYSAITGEFRTRNSDLFLREDAPEELQKLFYTKSMSPQIFLEHPEYIQFLHGKNLGSCFKKRIVKFSADNKTYTYGTIYEFLSNIADFDTIMSFITEYGDVLDIVCDATNFDSYDEYISFTINDDIDTLKEKIHKTLKKIIIEKGCAYPKHVPESFIRENPKMFLDKSAPPELKEVFYSRKLTPDFILSNASYIDYLKNVDMKLLYKCMYIRVKTSNGNYEQINFLEFIEQIFGSEEAFEVMLLYGKYIDQIFKNDLSKDYTFSNDISKDEILDKIDEIILQNIICGNMNYDNSFPAHFKDNYPRLFLSEKITDENIRTRFYNRSFLISDFISDSKLLDAFGETSITFGLIDKKYCDVGMYLSNEVFLFIIDRCGEDFLTKYPGILSLIIKINNPYLTIKEFKERVLEYFKEVDIIFPLLTLFDENENSFINEVKENLDALLKTRPELDFNNPALTGKLISSKIINTYGYEIISKLLEYNSGAAAIIVEESQKETSLMEKWIKYVKQLPFFDSKILHHAVLMYHNSEHLINELVNYNNQLTDIQFENLHEIIIQDNEYNVNCIEELTNYSEYRSNYLESKVNSDSLNDIKSGLLEILFNTTLEETNRFFYELGLGSDLFVEILLEDKVIDESDRASIEIIKEILGSNSKSDIVEKFSDAYKIGNITNFTEIFEKIKRYFGKCFKDSLTHIDVEAKDGITFSTIQGIDEPDMYDIDGKLISSKETIRVVEFEGIEFKLLIHKLHNYDPNFKNFASLIIEQPELWNRLEGASTLSTSMISDTHFNCVGSGFGTYYGFDDITEESLMLMGPRDIYVEHGGRKLEPTSNEKTTKFMIPDVLQTESVSYNEVALDRKSSSSQKYDHRIQPTCIICFSAEIPEASIRAAQYFNIPIYIIHIERYIEKNNAEQKKYDSGNITSFTIEDCKKIMYMKGKLLSDKYNLVLKLSDKALLEKMITEEQYINILMELRRIIAYYSAHSDISDIQLSEIDIRINKLNQLTEVNDESKQRQ